MSTSEAVLLQASESFTVTRGKAFRRLVRDRTAMAGLSIILLVAAACMSLVDDPERPVSAEALLEADRRETFTVQESMQPVPGTAYVWPGHLYGDPNPMPPKSDPRWWRDNYDAWVVPHRVLASVTAALPLLWLVRARRARGLCPACGYDLRASPDRCLECGTIATR